jgi:CHAT domain-containing protein
MKTDLLRVPFECILDGSFEAANHLVLRHPIARTIINNRPINLVPISPGLFNDISAKGEKLKVLLIASNTEPPIPAVDREIKTLSRSIKFLFRRQDVLTEIKVILANQATYDKVKTVLRKCDYHIIHFAGHCNYDPDAPSASYFPLWEKRNKQGIPKRLSVAEIHQLLQGSDTRFVYLSCCRGADTGAATKLLDAEFLGMADSIIRAGVPAVLGFRWPVSDSGALTLALEFYESLAEQGQLDTALLHARSEVAARNPDDITWLSPILIMQA